MSPTKIPNGDETIKVELTVKEAIALTGVHFHFDPAMLTDARRKLLASLEEKTSRLH